MRLGPGGDANEAVVLPRELRLPVLLLAKYLFFLNRRPISESNLHYLVSRLQGLKALAPLFENSDNPLLNRVVSQLHHLHPAAFHRVSSALQLSLYTSVEAAWPLPQDVVVQESAPDDKSWLRDARRALLVFGPGIGIGDELILAPLPQLLKNENPSLEVATLSGYKGFWNRVGAVDEDLHYASHLDLLRALRGAEPFDGRDLVIFVDFESPELYRGVAAEGTLQKYLEISLGARTAVLFDSARRWIYRLSDPDPYFQNYYHALHHLLRSLGIAPRAGERFTNHVRRGETRPADRLDVFVSPFTSKYDPSAVYWSRLLTRLVPRADGFPVTLHVDTGKHWKTQRFAIELVRSVAPTLPSNAEIRLARDATPPSLSLPGVYDYLQRCHAVICSDSFAAHAAPLFDCLTLVVAKSELKDWQVPSGNSFYFDAESAVDPIAAVMGELLSETLRPKTAVELSAMFSKAELELCSWGDALEAGFESDNVDETLYARFANHYRVVAEKRNALPAPFFRGDFAAELRGPGGAESSPPLTQHLRDQLERWQNTNFSKYVRRASRHAKEEDTAPRERSAHSSAGEARATRAAEALLNGIRAILREQLPSGEIPTYFRFGDGGLEYRRSPLVSSFVHDSLGSFDLKSRWVETDFLDALPAGTQGRFIRAAALVRKRIRRFLLWEEGNFGGWCFHGRASSLGPDADTTACAAATVLQSPRRNPGTRWRIHADSLMTHAAHPPDLIARVNILRYFALIGEPTGPLQEWITNDLRTADFAAAGARYGHPLVLPFCVARAWAQAGLPGRAEIASLLLPHVLSALRASGNGNGALGTALALNACADLEYQGPETIAAGQYLLDTAMPAGGWAYAPFLENSGGAAACTSALAMTALTRSGVGR